MLPDAKAVGVCLWASGFSPCYWFLQSMGIQTPPKLKCLGGLALLEVLHNMGTPKKKINKKPLLSQAKAFRFP